MLQEGLVYFHGRDRNYRPLLHINTTMLTSIETTNEDLITACLYAVEFAIKYMFIKGKIENCTMINDCKDLNVLTFPYGMLKALLGALNTNFKGFTRSGFILNSPATFSVLYNAVSFMMDET